MRLAGSATAVLCALAATSVHADTFSVIRGGSFEDGRLPFTSIQQFPWTLQHSTLGEDAICTSACFSAYEAADGEYYVLLAGGTFEENTTGVLRSPPIPVPASATTFEFDWAILGNGGDGAPCAGQQDGLTLLIDDVPVWSNLDAGKCVNVVPYDTVTIDLADLGLNDRRYHVFEFRGAATGVPPATAISNVYLDNLRLDVPGSPDSDGDGVPDSLDNCTLVANPSQCDTDLDRLGNRCDADFNNDCAVNIVDLGIFRTLFFQLGNQADLNCDGITNAPAAVDLGLFRTLYYQPVGPSGLSNVCE